MAMSYPSVLHGITEEMREFIPGDRLEHLTDFYAARVENSWYLDALAVNPEFRGEGIGTELIGLVKARGWDRGYRTLSLVTFADNEAALRVYGSVGLETVRQVEILPNEFIDHEGGGLLLKCDIASLHDLRSKT
jgi:ribosomal protein S18 acetylase RimI-like enzyme